MLERLEPEYWLPGLLILLALLVGFLFFFFFEDLLFLELDGRGGVIFYLLVDVKFIQFYGRVIRETGYQNVFLFCKILPFSTLYLPHFKPDKKI